MPLTSNLPTKFGLGPEALLTVFPFHIAFNRDLAIIQYGPALLKLIPELSAGHPLSAYFHIVTPNVPLTYEAIQQQSFTVFFIESLDKRFKLKGQMLPSHDRDQDLMLYLGSPVVRELSSVSGIGLTLKDFAIHDSAVDFLILLQTKTNTINDVKGMAERLKKEVAERREAQKDLQKANEVLEERVRERTSELEMANTGLLVEINERQLAEDRVRVTNAQLKSVVRRLEEHNRQMFLLNTMGDMLQACKSVQETYTVIADSLAKLFPDEGGSLALLVSEDGRYHAVAAWGKADQPTKPSFTRDDCWGLRRARLHEYTYGTVDSCCAHIQANEIHTLCRHVCIPLANQGNLLGLLHLSGQHTPSLLPDGEAPDADNDRRQLIHTAAEHISLAIANLRLQEHLRQQSILDALTGLYKRRHMEASLNREIARSNRSGKPCGIVMLDVDHFKKFNDTYGHQAGDALLHGLGQFLRKQVRGEDIPCRYGGEEFILILPGAAAEGAATRAEQIRLGVETTLKIPHEGGFLPQVTISLGVAAYPTHAQSAEDTVKAADAALYQAKKNGRNQVTICQGTGSTEAR